MFLRTDHAGGPDDDTETTSIGNGEHGRPRVAIRGRSCCRQSDRLKRWGLMHLRQPSAVQANSDGRSARKRGAERDDSAEPSPAESVFGRGNRRITSEFF
jgi:hypothetical protein